VLERILVEERSSPDLRCSLCHDTGGRLESCPTCGTVFHGACRAHDRRCPTLGCSERHRRIGPIGVATRELPEPSWSLFAQALGSSFTTAMLALGAFTLPNLSFDDGSPVLGAGWAASFARALAPLLLLVHFFYAPARWAVLRRGTRSRRRAAGITLGSIASLVLLGAALAWFGDSDPLVPVAAGALVIFLGPAIGAWLGAGASADDAPLAAP
jgi:hypothetical protein